MKVIIFRLATGALLAICSIVVLAISAHVESSIRQFDLSTSTFTFDAFIGALTLVVEVGLALTRWLTTSPVNGVGAELAVQGLLWIMWLAAGIATTVRTEEDRGFCKHLGDFEDSPELEGIDPDLIATARRILQSACSEIHAELAFIWISFVVSTIIVLHLFRVGTQAHKRIGRVAWRSHLATMDHASEGGVDPFADPAGAVPGPSVGVVRAPYDEDPDRK